MVVKPDCLGKVHSGWGAQKTSSQPVSPKELMLQTIQSGHEIILIPSHPLLLSCQNFLVFLEL